MPVVVLGPPRPLVRFDLPNRGVVVLVTLLFSPSPAHILLFPAVLSFSLKISEIQTVSRRYHPFAARGGPLRRGPVCPPKFQTSPKDDDVQRRPAPLFRPSPQRSIVRPRARLRARADGVGATAAVVPAGRSTNETPGFPASSASPAVAKHWRAQPLAILHLSTSTSQVALDRRPPGRVVAPCRERHLGGGGTMSASCQVQLVLQLPSPGASRSLGEDAPDGTSGPAPRGERTTRHPQTALAPGKAADREDG